MTIKEQAKGWAVALTTRFIDGVLQYSPENQALVFDYHLYLHKAAGEALSEVPTHQDLQELEAILRAYGLDPATIQLAHKNTGPHTYEPHGYVSKPQATLG